MESKCSNYWLMTKKLGDVIDVLKLNWTEDLLGQGLVIIKINQFRSFRLKVNWTEDSIG